MADVVDYRRHAPLGRRRPLAQPSPRRLPAAFVGRGRGRSLDIYASDQVEARRGNRFRWLLSTCLAASVGATAIAVVIVGSMESGERDGGLLPALKRMRDSPLVSLQLPLAHHDGLKWAVPKADKLLVATGAAATKFIIHETMRRRIGARERIEIKPYARVLARLAPIPAAQALKVPPFNPYKLYAALPAADEAGKAAEDTAGDVAVKVVELLGGILPGDDGQELDAREVGDIVRRVQSGDDELAPMRPSFKPEGAERLGGARGGELRSPNEGSELLAPNTSVLTKSAFEGDDTGDDLAGREVRVVKAARGDTLTRILTRLGAEQWQARAMVDAARSTFPENSLAPGHEVHVTLVPSVIQQNRVEPVRFSVFGEGHEHKVTVARNAAGEFVTSGSPIDERIARAAMGNEDLPQAMSLYTSLYHTALAQSLSDDAILQILRIHAYETDFRRRVRAGDSVEWFFDVRDEDKAGEGSLGELLATSITTGGETQRFFRFRTPDGVVDYYDEYGNTSRKFLMRRPVRGEEMRLASGFGMRRHPILGIVRPHFGVDWAGPTGTPIMAAGSGTVEEAGRKSEYGNYIRIRHANGYKTAYAHLSRINSGISEGVAVRQGQVIGYTGNTGLSAGPHLHYEVLVNNQHVDPMSIQVPRERRLTGKQLAEFQKERARVEELIRRNPVSAKSETAVR